MRTNKIQLMRFATLMLLTAVFAMNCAIAKTGPQLPPDRWQAVTAKSGPIIPPDPWQGVTAKSGPIIPPDPWQG